MADAYTNDLRLREQEVGANSGAWGGYLNTTLENIAESWSYGTEALADSATQTLTLADGASDQLRSFYVKLTGTLSQATTVTIAPNTISKSWMIENATTGGYAVTLSQGSGANVTVANGNVKMIATDGAGAGGVVHDLLTDLELAGDLDVDGTANLDIVDIDGAVNMATTALVTGVLTTTAATVHTNGITMPDSAKAIFGAGSDLQIYHDGSNSYIDDVTGSGTGDLYIKASDAVRVLTPNFIVNNAANNENLITASEDGAAILYHNGTARVSTSSVGASLSGQVVIDPADGEADEAYALTVRNQEATAGRNYGAWVRGGSNSSDESFSVRKFDNSATYFKVRGDGNVGIGTTSPSSILHLKGTGETQLYIDAAASNNSGVRFLENGTSKWTIGNDQSNDSLFFYDFTASATRLTIDSSGNTTIGSAVGSEKLSVAGSITSDGYIYPTTDLGWSLGLATNRWGSIFSGTITSNTLNSASGNDLRLNAGSANRDVFFQVNGSTLATLQGSTGNFSVTGALSKGSGSFKIDHPLESKKDTHHLVHSFIEGPQADLIYRGTVDLVDGSATVNLDSSSGMTDGTFVLLNTNVQCFTSNESGWTAIKGSVSGNVLTITSQESCTDTISWMVVGERHDKHMKNTDWTDADGKVIVEPEKKIEPEGA